MAVSEPLGNQHSLSLIVNYSLSPVSLVFPASRICAGILHILSILIWTSP